MSAKQLSHMSIMSTLHDTNYHLKVVWEELVSNVTKGMHSIFGGLITSAKGMHSIMTAKGMITFNSLPNPSTIEAKFT